MPVKSIISLSCGTTSGMGRMRSLAPPELVRLRTLPNFRDRLAVMLPDIRVVGPAGAPLGFCVRQG